MLRLCTYRVFLVIFLGVYIQTCGTTGGHSLVAIFSGKETVLLLAVVNTLDHLWSNQRALRHDSFKSHHPIQVLRTQGAGIARKFSERSVEGTIVKLMEQLISLMLLCFQVPLSINVKHTASSDDSFLPGITCLTTSFKAVSKDCVYSKGDVRSLFEI